jgi:hypothetical protein
MTDSYPTPALCDTLSWIELRILVDRLYNDLENHKTLVAALRANLAAVREARDGWPGERVEYLVADDRLDVIDEAMRKP